MPSNEKEYSPFDLNAPRPVEEKKDLLPATVPEFRYPGFGQEVTGKSIFTGRDKYSGEYKEFDPEDIGFTERKAAPLDLAPIMKQTRQRQAITGVTPSSEFVSGIAEPALKEKTKEAIAFEELNRQREIEQRKQAFTEYSTTRGQEFAEFGAERDIAFKQHVMEWEREVKEIELQIAKTQAEKDTGGGCIIVTACHGKDSEEVNITREYRNEFLDKETLRGYYMLAEQLVPKMVSNDDYKEYIKDNFVEHFIEVGKYRLGETDIKPSEHTINITDGFLNTCKIMGKSIESFTRSNGEVI